MKAYTYRISDSYIILITSDANFRGAFLEYFADRYSPHNRRGFAKVFAVRSFNDALALFNIQHERYIVVIDSYAENGDISSFLAGIREKFTQQLTLFYDDPKELQAYQRLIERQIFLVILDDSIEPSLISRFNEHIQARYLQKPITLDALDKSIYPYVFVEAQWLRDPITYLPSGQLIVRKIEEIANSIQHTSFFIKIVGFNKSNTEDDRDKQIEIMHFIVEIIEQAVEEQADSQSWIGHAGGFDFFIVIGRDHLKSVIQQIQFLFESGIQAFYSPEQMERLSIVFHCQYKL